MPAEPGTLGTVYFNRVSVHSAREMVRMVANDDLYKVVVNHEMEYSLWPAGRSNPMGWRDAGRQGSREQCLAHVRSVWTDMRPLSLRREMACSPLDDGCPAPERQAAHAC